MDLQTVLFCLFPFFFILMWVVVSSLLANISGWSRLAEHYPAQTTFEGKKWRFSSGRMGLTRYRSCLTIGANNYGLYLAVLLPFRAGHPPLFIPWTEITTSQSKSFLVAYLDFAFARTPSITFKVSEKLGNTILAARTDIL